MTDLSGPDRLQQLLERATPGPWSLQAKEAPWNRVILDGKHAVDAAGTVLIDGGRFKRAEDAALIVEAVNLLPKLIALWRAAEDVKRSLALPIGIPRDNFLRALTALEQEQSIGPEGQG